jgi:hypothetical protein
LTLKEEHILKVFEDGIWTYERGNGRRVEKTEKWED